MENSLELSKISSISDFSFFQGTELQKKIAKFSGLDLAKFLAEYPNAQGLCVYELWRVGKMETVFDFFVLPDHLRKYELREDKIVYTASYLRSLCNLSVYECTSFVKDLTYVSANAHDDQSFGELPLYPEVVLERVERLMAQVEDCVASGDFNEYVVL